MAKSICFSFGGSLVSCEIISRVEIGGPLLPNTYSMTYKVNTNHFVFGSVNTCGQIVWQRSKLEAKSTRKRTGKGTFYCFNARITFKTCKFIN